MARLTQVLAAGAVWLGLAIALRAQDLDRQGITSAGVCARCHISSSLEWGISKHSTITGAVRSPNCVGCHGPSKGHIADEQNSVKPDHIPRGAAIAALCVQCHRAGCPQTLAKATCQDCHHPHALVNPKLDAAAVEALADPKVQTRLVDLGYQVFPRERQTPEALGAMQKADAEKWWPIIKASGIKSQ